MEKEELLAAMDELLEPASPKGRRRAPALTAMEKTILQHVLDGKTSRQIANALHRLRRTIEIHRRNIMRKLGASSQVDLVRQAIRLGAVGAHDEN